VTITTRAAQPREYDRIGEITVEAYIKDGLISLRSAYLNTLRDAADRAEQAELIVAELDGELVGSVTYCRPESPYAEIAAPDEAEFRMLAVMAAARGRGVGQALIQECIDRAVAAGYSMLRLSSQRNMRTAHRIYERMGFQRTPDLDWSPVPGVTLWAYALPLVRSGS
jgi:ribosomal protein S18 acetylase RimI-like enzyme